MSTSAGPGLEGPGLEGHGPEGKDPEGKGLDGHGLDAVARTAVTVDECATLGEAWSACAADPDRVGVVLRGRTPIAVVTAGEIAERWPGGGPIASWATSVSAVLDRPLGVETIDSTEDLTAAARRLVMSGRPALPVLPVPGWPVRVVTVRDVLWALAGCPTS